MGYAVAQNGRSYDEGVAAGEIAQRLKDHDKHFEKLNGSVGELAAAMQTQNLLLQGITDSMAADRATVLTTAEALEKERASAADVLKKERDTSERRWSPLSRLGIAVGVLAGLASIIVTILLVTGH